MLRDMCRSFADNELAPNAGEWDKNHTFPKDQVRVRGSTWYHTCFIAVFGVGVAGSRPSGIRCFPAGLPVSAPVCLASYQVPNLASGWRAVIASWRADPFSSLAPSLVCTCSGLLFMQCSRCLGSFSVPAWSGRYI